ncbi:unnamed protein product, partial [Amoebophrya sp. A120]
VEYWLHHEPERLGSRRCIGPGEVVTLLHEMARGNNSAFGLVKLSKLNLDQDLVATVLVHILPPVVDAGVAAGGGTRSTSGTLTRSPCNITEGEQDTAEQAADPGKQVDSESFRVDMCLN